MSTPKSDLARDIAAQFDVPLPLVSLAPWGTGHINDTFLLIAADGARFILQRLNPTVFLQGALVMENIERVTTHLQKKYRARGLDPRRHVLEQVPTHAGAFWCQDAGGAVWRVYHAVADAHPVIAAPTPQLAYHAARAFGEFISLLADLPAPPLHETIPHFHDTPARLAQLQQAVAADTARRVAHVAPELAFVAQRHADVHSLADLVKAGRLPLRVTHNDTKLDNILFDDHTGDARCVIDLDTVMPGLALHDFGDCVRATARIGAEDEPDPRNVGLNLEVFAQLVRGFRDGAGAQLAAAECALLAQAAKVITLEQGMRFLTDHLKGDTYFKIHRPGHNLERARAQFALVAALERHAGALAAIVQSV
ncbi:MAG: aminoglycoside phosphotransferase family protein [bacterium]|nr:aminoglycoside phosphotransferase family protein [bacterium]